MIKILDTGNRTEVDRINFPCGETHVRVKGLPPTQIVNIGWDYEKDVELLELLFIVDAVKRLGREVGELVIPYFPFARQDRVAVSGEAFTLKVVAEIINSIGAKKVTVLDPHSDVVAAVVNNINVIPQDEIFEEYLKDSNDFYLIACDAGAMKKTYKLASKVNPIEVIECSKRRNVKTGEITNTVVHADDLHGKPCIMVDDICDGGRTFIEVAKKLREKNAGKIILMVTHGFFTKGLEVFDGIIDEIYTRKGKVPFIPFNPAKETK